MRLFFTAIALLSVLSGCNTSTQPALPPPTPVELAGRTMGTTYSIKYWQRGQQQHDESAQQALQADIDTRLDEINQQMSTYLPDSELSQFNTAEPNVWFPVSPPTAFVVQQALHFHELTGGASDVTVGPLVRLWDFGPQHKASDATPKGPPEEPSAEALRSALDRTGCESLQVRLNPPALRKLKAGLEVDLSSIAKGYAVDVVAELLVGQGIANFMVEIGGEVRAAGLRPDGVAWRIGLESPIANDRRLQRVVALEDAALASSGDYRNFRRAGGRIYCHIIDPQSGQPLPYHGVSVTVLADSCLEADALATALLVMGSEKGYHWCEAHDIRAMFISLSEQGTTLRSTPRFPQK